MRKVLFVGLILTSLFAKAQINQQWLKSFNGNGYREYYNVQTLDDNSGNFYVGAGFYSLDSIKASTSQVIKRSGGFIIIKYTSTGNSLTGPAWSKTVENATFLDFKSMFVTNGGDVFVAVTEDVVGQGKNARLYKYASSNGTLQSNYPISYNSANANNDEAFGVVVDANSNNFFIASNDSVGGLNSSITLRKYTNVSNPVLQWTKRYRNASTTNNGLQLIINGADPIIIAETFSTTKDFTLLGFATSNGALNVGTVIPQDGSFSDVKFCHVIRTSTSNILVGVKGKTSATTFTGVGYKLSSSGTLIATITMDGTDSNLDGRLRLTDIGGITYLGQNEQNGSVFKLQKFDNTNTPQWASAYSISSFKLGDLKTEATSSISIYVAGTTTGGSAEGDDARLVKINTNGTQLYSQTYDNTNFTSNENPTSLIVRQGGIASLSGLMTELNGTSKIFTTANKGDGSLIGTKIFIDYDDNARNLVTDVSGNVYVSGITTDASNISDIFVSKYNSLGTLLWNTKIGVPSKNETTGTKQLVVDANGNVFVVGSIVNASTDIIIACLRASDGAINGQATFNGAGSSTDTPNAIVVDGNSNVYITGETRPTGANKNIAILKYNKFCVQQFAVSYELVSGSNETGRDIILDSGGNIYVVGESSLATTNRTLITTLKYSNSGSFAWVDTVMATSTGAVRSPIGGMAIDGSNNIYVTAFKNNLSGNSDAITIKYNTTGTKVWTNIYNNGTNAETGVDVSVNINGEVAVGGQSSIGAAQDILILKINPDGASNFATTYNGAGNGNDFIKNVFINSSGHIFIGSQFVNTSSNTDAIILQYNNTGVVANNTSLNIGTSDLVSRVYFDGLGKAYVFGTANLFAPNDAFIDSYLLPITNEAPQVSNFTNQSTCGAAVGPQSFTVIDETIGSVVVSGTSNNTSVIPNNNIVFGGSGNNKTVTVTPVVGQSGLVTISITANDAASNLTTKTFAVNVSSVPATPTINASGSTTICPGGNVTLTSSSATGNVWSTNAITQSIVVSSAASITVSNTNNCGTSTSAATTVTVGSAPSQPSSFTTFTITVCMGNTYDYTVPAVSGATSYTWSYSGNGASFTSTSNTVSILFDNTTTAGTLGVTANNACGSSSPRTLTTIVGNNPIAPIVFASNNPICQGSNTILGSNVSTVDWFYNGGLTSFSSNSSPTISAAGTYQAVNTTICGSAASNIITLIVNPLPIASTISAGSATTFCDGGSVTLSGNSTGIWSTSETNPSIDVTNSGTYSVTTANSCGSTTSNSIEVTVETCNNNPITQLRSIDCGKINLTLSAQIACVAVAGATNYEFEFTDATTNAFYATKVMSGTFIAGNNVTPNLQWNTQYKCKVRAKIGGIWGNYGVVCIIGLVQDPAIVGVPLTSLRSTSCNQLNLLPTATIVCQQISMSAGYEFEFTDMVTNAVTTKVSSLNYLPLATVTPNLIPMHTYSVKVRAKQYTTWGSYGEACNIRISGATVARTAMNTDQETVDAMVSEMEEERMNTDMPMDILLFPNPMMDEATVVISSSQNEKATIAITDITGKVVSNDIFNTNSTFSIQNSELRSGIYFLTATTTSGERKTMKVVKQ